MNRTYSPEMRERASRMLAEARPERATMMTAIRHVAGLLGTSPETPRLWQPGPFRHRGVLIELAGGCRSLGGPRGMMVMHPNATRA